MVFGTPTTLTPSPYSRAATPSVSSPPIATSASTPRPARLSFIRSTPLRPGPVSRYGFVRDEPRMVPPRGRMPRTAFTSSGTVSASIGPRQPSRNPTNSRPKSWIPLRTRARMTAFNPGQSPPPVRTPTRMGPSLAPASALLTDAGTTRGNYRRFRRTSTHRPATGRLRRFHVRARYRFLFHPERTVPTPMPRYLRPRAAPRTRSCDDVNHGPRNAGPPRRRPDAVRDSADRRGAVRRGRRAGGRPGLPRLHRQPAHGAAVGRAPGGGRAHRARAATARARHHQPGSEPNRLAGLVRGGRARLRRTQRQVRAGLRRRHLDGRLPGVPAGGNLGRQGQRPRRSEPLAGAGHQAVPAGAGA